MSDYEIFEIKLLLSINKQIYEENLITYDKYIFAAEELNKRLIDK